MDPDIEEITREFESLASPEGLRATMKFVPTSTQVYGVRMPQLNELARKYKSGGIELSRLLWEEGSFEHRMLAVKLLEKVPRTDVPGILPVLDHYKDDIKDWAICDTLGSQGIRKVLKYHPEECFDRAKEYLESNNPWVIRLGIVMLIHFTKLSNYRFLIPALVKHLETRKEHYIKKAMVWLHKSLEKNSISS